MTIMTTRRPQAGLVGDMTEDDDRRGFERDETDTNFHQLVRHLTADGDHRAQTADRHARRTLAEMAPGCTRQPVLLLTRPLPMRPAMNGPCPLCERWNCDPSNCPPRVAPAARGLGASGVAQ